MRHRSNALGLLAMVTFGIAADLHPRYSDDQLGCICGACSVLMIGVSLAAGQQCLRLGQGGLAPGRTLPRHWPDYAWGDGWLALRRTAEDPLLIGSVKSNMGHCEGCSGLAGAALTGPAQLSAG